MSEPDLSRLREEYAAGGLSESDLPPDPLVLFRRWLDDAIVAPLDEPNAMVVSTVSAEGGPASRIVLLKGLDDGFVFFTNYASRKGEELEADPRCALLFPWHSLQRQVRVEGRASRVHRSETEAYFASRPRDSQLGAWASPQSQAVEDRAALDRAYEEAAGQFSDSDVPAPPHWGGYRVVPQLVEFWQGRTGRMHDRLCFRRTADGWTTARLAP